MNISLMRKLSFLFVLLGVSGLFGHVRAAAPDPAPAAVQLTVANDDEDKKSDFDNDSDSDWRDHHRLHFRRHGGSSNDRVTIGHDTHLGPDEQADSVVAVLGSATSEGEANDVTAVMGNVRATGPVHDTAVAVFGSVYVDSRVNRDVVAVFGNVDLGPHAEVGGDVVAVFGTVTRDSAAVIHGGVENVFDVDVSGVHGLSGTGWLQTWVKKCLLLGRPLALSPGLGWAWSLALIMLLFYAVLAVMFRPSVDSCVHTLETQPGQTALAALLGMLLTPVLLVLLCITVIGIAAVPFVIMALFCMSLFGKAVILAWLGGRITGRRPGPAGHPALAVLIGGAVVLALYIIPVVGFLVYKLLGFFGFGAVLYTLISGVRARRAVNSPPAAALGSGGAVHTGAVHTGAASGAESVAGSAAAGANPAAASYAAPIAADLPRAGFWIRMAALLLDVVLVGFAMSLLHNPLGDFHIVILAIYGAVMWKLRGTTVGGIVFDLHVVRVDGRPLDWETAVVRALGCFLSLAVVGLGFIWIALDDNHQAWHDKIAGTVVVRAKRNGAPLV
jgi:uncharacterized RDD family membrane protein YckC